MPKSVNASVHFERDVVDEVDALTEAFCDALDGRDVIDLVDVHAQAASADARGADARQFHGSSSSSR